MSRRRASNWIKSYVNLFAPRSEAPPHIHWWVACSCIGGAATRRVWIDEQTFRYYPNLFIAIVGPPAIIAKSTTLNLGINILKELPNVYIGADNTTYPAFIQDLAKHQTEVKNSFPQDDKDAEWILQCAITLPISEFGTFFKPEDEDMVNGLTDLFDCRAIHVKDTKTAGTDVVEHPFVNLIACTTPDWVRDKLKASIGGWGLSSRIIFLWADEKVQYIPRPSKLWKSGQFEVETQKLVDDLKTISQLSGTIEFSKDADILWDKWYRENMGEIAEYNKLPDHNTWISYFLGRKQVHIQKLAMILSMSRGNSLIIEEEDIQESINRVTEIEQGVRNVFANKPLPTALAAVEQYVIGIVRVLVEASPTGEIPRMTIYSRVSGMVDSGTVNKIVEGAVGRGEFRQRIAGGVTYVKLP